MEVKKRNKIAVVIVAIVLLIAGGAILISNREEKGEYESGKPSVEIVLKSSSTRKEVFSNETKGAIIASESQPYYALIGTPVALIYEGGEKIAIPLVVINKDKPSSAVTKFLLNYKGNGNLTAIGIGDVGSEFSIPIVQEINKETLEKTSLEVAKMFWESTDGVIIVRANQEGYNFAVVASPLASYLNIPIIVMEEKKIDSKAAEVLKKLDVKFSLVCGNVEGYKKSWHFGSVEEIQDLTIKVIRERLNENIFYIALANPIDAKKPKVLSSKTFTFHGNIQDESGEAYPGTEPPPSEGSPEHFVDIPYNYSNMVIDIKMDLSGVVGSADLSGERIYAYIGVDEDKDRVLNNDEDSENDKLQFFGGSPGYDYIRPGANSPPSEAWFHTEIPFFHDIGEHAIVLMARLPMDMDKTASYDLTVTIEELENENYPLMPQISSLAGYLAAYRKGVVLAKPEFRIYNPKYIGCKDCGDPASNPDLLEETNRQSGRVKKDLNKLLAKLAGMVIREDKNGKQNEEDVIALAEYYKSLDPNTELMHIGIIADTNMIPWFYYHTSGQEDYGATEGYGIPGDNIYADIDASISNAPYEIDGEDPSMELAIGRIVGWDVQDVSALLGRTFFYYDILDSFEGINGDDWKNSAFAHFGSEPPVESAASVTEKLVNMWRSAGFTADEPLQHSNELSRRQVAEQYYERSNFIMFCAHGFYYWYVPTAQESIPSMVSGGYIPAPYGGGAFDVIHVKDFNMGPGIIFGSSCVTGKIDGIQPRIALSQAFLHAGLNTYIGASRLSWGSIVPIPDENTDEVYGDYLALLIYGYLTGGIIYDKENPTVVSMEYENVTIGGALMLAKNKYIEDKGSDGGGPGDDTIEEFNIMGDPAFNPYEPNHEG